VPNLAIPQDVLAGRQARIRRPPGRTVVAIRPEAGQKLHAGFQRHVDRQASRYAEQLAHAAQLADRFECGDVIGVFSTQTGGDIRPRAYVVGLLPITAIPVLIAGAQVIEVWTDVYNISAEESRPALTAYRLRWATGRHRRSRAPFRTSVTLTRTSGHC
jgi:hypothetical protein